MANKKSTKDCLCYNCTKKYKHLKPKYNYKDIPVGTIISWDLDQYKKWRIQEINSTTLILVDNDNIDKFEHNFSTKELLQDLNKTKNKAWIINSKTSKNLLNTSNKKKTKKKSTMSDKILLPKNAELKYNLLCKTDVSNKFYQIYIVENKSNKMDGNSTYSVYTSHGRVGHNPVIGIYRDKCVYESDANTYAKALFVAKSNKGYKINTSQLFTSGAKSALAKINKKPGRPSKQDKITQEQLEKESRGTGRFSLLDL